MTERVPEARPDPRGTGTESAPGVPRWVKVCAVLVGLIVLVVAAQLLMGGGGHGPGRHGALEQATTWAPAAVSVDSGV